MIPFRTCHISFDVWNTLIKPNPKFARVRSNFIADHFGLDREETSRIYKTTKDEYDAMAETDGLAFDSQAVYGILFDKLGVPRDDWKFIMEETERLFLENPPIITDSTVETLRYLSRGYSLSIASNTNFTSGRILARVLDERFGDIFAFKVFSDLHGHAKPHREFFRDVITGAAKVHTIIRPRDIIHVGDNTICDGGATMSGLEFFYVSGPEMIPDIISHLGIPEQIAQ